MNYDKSKGFDLSVAGEAQVGEKRVCKISPHPSGFGFAEWETEEGKKVSLFLSPREMRKVFRGDVVEITAMASEKSPGEIEGRIDKVLARSGNPVVAVSRGDVYMPEDGSGAFMSCTEMMPKDTVVALLPSLDLDEKGFVVSSFSGSLGVLTDPWIKTAIQVCRYGIPDRWDESTINDALSVSRKRLTADGRRDVRKTAFVTIDGESTKDFDDAVHVERAADGSFVLSVAIADVAEYVQKGSPLDLAARDRATSVYFPDRVIPMLPRELSDGVCSLNPGEEKFVVCCDMHITKDGVIESSEFYEALFVSHARLTYGQASSMRDSSPLMSAIADCAEALEKAKSERGTMEFSTGESYLKIENGKVVSVETMERTPAHRWVEDMMLAANTCAAELLMKAGFPAMYRNHAAPCQIKWSESLEKLSEMGVDVEPKDFSEVSHFAETLSDHEGKPSFWMVQSEMLKSFSPAEYGAENEGHFSLNLPTYVHFTSPIRRYPDTLVHRAIKSLLRGEKPESPEDMMDMAKFCAVAQRRANIATREAKNAFLNDWFAATKDMPRKALVKSPMPKGGVKVMLLDCGYETVLKNTEAPVGTELDVWFKGFDRSGKKPDFSDSPLQTRSFRPR